MLRSILKVYILEKLCIHIFALLVKATDPKHFSLMLLWD